MSRIGKKPISIPNGLEVKIDGSSLKFKKSNNEKELDLKGHDTFLYMSFYAFLLG